MKDKTLLERLGIIERIEPEDSVVEETPSVGIAVKPTTNAVETASELVPTASVPTVAEFHFKTTDDEPTTVNSEIVSSNKAKHDVDQALAFVKEAVAESNSTAEIRSINDAIEDNSNEFENIELEIADDIAVDTNLKIETAEETDDDFVGIETLNAIEEIEEIGIEKIIEKEYKSVDDYLSSIDFQIPEIVEAETETEEHDTSLLTASQLFETAHVSEPQVEEETMNTVDTHRAQHIDDLQYVEDTQEHTQIVEAMQSTEEVYTQYLNTDKYCSISDLYKSYGKKLAGTDTIFIVDAFAKSLPDTLSANLKKQSVLNIIQASNINLEELVADGLSRIDNINSYLSTFKQHTEQLVQNKETQIAQLEQQIAILKREVKERNRLQEKQETTIDFETHRIQSALEFIANND